MHGCYRCSCLPLVTKVAQSLPFAPDMQKIADLVLSEMAAAGINSFNGLHLRMEADAEDWGTLMGGDKVEGCHFLSASVLMCRGISCQQ